MGYCKVGLVMITSISDDDDDDDVTDDDGDYIGKRRNALSIHQQI